MAAPPARTWEDLPFADGVYRFGLDMGGIMAVEAACGVHWGAIQRRTLAGRWSPDPEHFDPRSTEYSYGEVVEVIRQGLIRGAFCVIDGVEKRVTSEMVKNLVRDYLDTISPQQMPVNEAWSLAWNVVAGRTIGFSPPKDSDPKAEPGKDPATETSSPSTGASS